MASLPSNPGGTVSTETAALGGRPPLESGGDNAVPAPIASAHDVNQAGTEHAMTPDLDPAGAQRQVALAAAIAAVAHRDQRDKLGAAYIMHPARIAAGFTDDPLGAAAAWLHDVIEDTEITAGRLREAGIAEEIVEAVLLLTRTDDVASDDYYARIAAHPLARRVKLADIDDNTLPWRTGLLSPEKRAALAAKYAHARQMLGADGATRAAPVLEPATAETTTEETA